MLRRSGSYSLPHGVIKGLLQAKGVLSVLMKLPTGLKGSGKSSKLQSRLSWRKKNTSGPGGVQGGHGQGLFTKFWRALLGLSRLTHLPCTA